MPYFRPVPSQSLFQQSFVGKIFNKSEDSTELEEKEETKEVEEASIGMSDLLPIVKGFNIWQFAFFYTILCCRIKSIQGWIFSWLTWTYANVEGGDEIVSKEEVSKT